MPRVSSNRCRDKAPAKRAVSGKRPPRVKKDGTLIEPRSGSAKSRPPRIVTPEGEDIASVRSDGTCLIVSVALVAPGLNEMLRMHHREYAKVRDRWRQMFALVRPHGHVPFDRFAAHVTRHAPGHGLDLDNMYASCKIILDALRAEHYIVDDNPRALISLTCDQERSPRGTHVTVVRLCPA